MFDFGKVPGDTSESIFSGAEILEVRLEGNHMQKSKLLHLL